MHTSLYIAAAIGWIIWLAFNVINLRKRHQISLGSQSHEDLEKAIRAHGNTTEYLPLALIGMGAAEVGGTHWFFIHAVGIALALGRYWHNQGIVGEALKARVRGMYFTFFPLMAIAAFNLWAWLF